MEAIYTILENIFGAIAYVLDKKRRKKGNMRIRMGWKNGRKD